MGGINYLIGIYPGVGGWGKLRTEGAEMKILTSKGRQ